MRVKTTTVDAPELVEKCLNCKKSYCNNCLSNPGRTCRINREEFMRLYGLGYSDQRIALALSVGVKTVGNYRRELRLKTNKG